ncbi:hypothetical protein [Wenyingzhuangia sp. 2_MG-2023]|uniref:hypothetical protein n=1 Tax=Wenyingzhuangia sp. 2_MG-2023 TaxID=3062639 RepID=UPI0026E4895F|nr:hypothetical protein [Wenyingzhuangia sp. 2_MG-2023]MDO6738658.1 hypothetical protein [Wenyingzhuangia sp. 2_MG-2023]
MISRYGDKNKFGSYTWHIKLNSLFHIFIEATVDNSFVVNFKEWRWINYKTHSSFISNNDFKSTIENAFEKAFEFFKGNLNYQWNYLQKNNQLNKVLELIENSKDQITIEYSKTNGNMYSASKTISLIRGLGIDGNIVNITLAEMIIEKYGNPEKSVNHNNFSIELKYTKKGMSFYYKLNDPFKIIYFMMATGEIAGETETGLIFNKDLTIDKVSEKYGIGEQYENSKSVERIVCYSGIQFYANLAEIIYKDDDDPIFIRKIGIIEF